MIETINCLHVLMYNYRECSHLLSLNASEWFSPQTPYLEEHTAIAPHIAGNRVLPPVNRLRGHPLERDFPSSARVTPILR